MPTVNLSGPPYDEQSISDAYDQAGCSGVGAHFAGNPINVGDCIQIGEKYYRITAIKVKCEGNTVYEQGTPPPSPADHVHTYSQTDVQIHLWLQEIPEEEYGTC